MSVGGLASALAMLFPRFADVWEIHPRDGQAVGKVWEAAIESVPEGQRPAGVLRAIERLPWVNAIATTAVVFLPRIRFTLQYLRKPRPDEQPQGWSPQAPPPAPAPTNGAARSAGVEYGGPEGPTVTQPAEDTRVKSVYETTNIDMSQLDGTAAGAGAND